MKFQPTDRQWTVVGLVLTVVLGLAGIYLTVREKRPALSIEIIRSTNLLNLDHSLSRLTVNYESEDIQKAGKSLQIVSLRFSNTGEVDIR